MKNLLLVCAAVLITTPAMALYTECTVPKDMELATRPNGPTEPRYRLIHKGDKVAFRNSYKHWWFVMHDADDNGTVDYGWIPHNVLTDCQKRDGTP
jgi:hypothetical protein